MDSDAYTYAQILEVSGDGVHELNWGPSKEASALAKYQRAGRPEDATRTYSFFTSM